MDLERELRPVQNHRGDAAGTLWRAKQGHGLLAHPARVTDQIPLLDELVARRALMASEGVGIRALLHLPLSHGHGDDAQAAFDDFLLDETAFGAGEGLVLTDKNEIGGCDADAVDGARLFVRVQQQRHLVVERHGERIDLHRRAVRPHVHLRRPDVHVRHFGQRAGFGDLHRQRRHAIHLGGVEQVAAGEAPRAIGDDTHAEALRTVQRQSLHNAILDGNGLILLAHDPNIGIRRALGFG